MQLKHPLVSILTEHLKEPEPLIQVILGPRQVGKTTAAQQLLDGWKGETLYVSADAVLTPGQEWLEMQWQNALLKSSSALSSTLFVVDEIQKIHNWAEFIKKLWDRQSRRTTRKVPALKCVLLGSSSLALQKGLTESLTGRFELNRAYHWNFHESKSAFPALHTDLNTYLSHGGYPGSYRFIKDRKRWTAFIKDSIIETVIGKDILDQSHVRKPALFRQAFEILCRYPAQEISYTKLLGQLQDQGNTDLVKHYIELYEGAFLFKALAKYGRNELRKRTSSPKILPLCPALYSWSQEPGFLGDPERKGRAFELAVGAELVRLPGELYYWRDADDEVDFIYEEQRRVWAIEVKSGRRKREGGLSAFKKVCPKAISVFITPQNFPQFSLDSGLFLEKLWQSG